MTKIDLKIFVESGRKAGSARGPQKTRGDSEYYRALSKKAVAARKAKKELENAQENAAPEHRRDD